jgi:tetratricopeptide (TPR) repeat protein
MVPIAATALSFSGIITDSFTNWDDNVYVTGNYLVHSLSLPNILRIFSPTTFVSGNYQPITILSYAANYAAGRLDPAGYILTDILIHLLNVLLVFIVIRKISGNDFTASLCALLSGIHPMHVESVAWISGRKDLLCTLFYLGSARAYLSYLEKGAGAAKRRYGAAWILFVGSLLSKSSAITLPAVLLFIDYYRGRKFSVRVIVEKIPFVVPSIFLGLWAIRGQHDIGSLDGQGALSIFTRIAVASHAFMFYVTGFFVPLKLSAYYPYPASLSVSLPLRYVLSPLFLLAAGIAAWYFRRSKAFVFGFGIFLVNVLFILHFVPVSSAVTADRFSYLAYIGLSFIVAHYLERGIDALPVKSVRPAARAALIGSIALIFGCAARDRCAVWKNSVTLWTDVIEKYPSPLAYNNRGYAHYLKRDYVHAEEDYAAGLSQFPSYADLYNDRGLLYDALGDHARAMEDYNQAIARKPGYVGAYINRGVNYYGGGDYDHALHDFDQAIALNPRCGEAYYNRGNILSGRGDNESAIADYSRAVSLNPEDAGAWYGLGRLLQAGHDFDRGIDCFTRTIAIDPGFEHAYNSRGIIYCREHKFDSAITDFNRAIALQPLSPDAYLNRGNAWSSRGGYTLAISDFSRAIDLLSAPEKYPQVFLNRGLAYQAIGDLEHAAEDFKTACAMHFDIACRALEGDSPGTPIN